ncbi:winged helix-turn-helix transcriptional regulator [Candidatus Woesearchaeota archaeon]|nr:winged helix-turn-helix transcriptional regulator [Candidatus Woesearchaeota archaeon]
MLKTNIDKILELLKKNKTMSASQIAKQIGISKESVKRSAKNMEEQGLLKIKYRFMNTYLTLNTKKQIQKKSENNKKDKELININKNLLDNENIKTQEKINDDSNYSSLDSDELNEIETPEENPALQKKFSKKKKNDEQKFIVVGTPNNMPFPQNHQQQGYQQSNQTGYQQSDQNQGFNNYPQSNYPIQQSGFSDSQSTGLDQKENNRSKENHVSQTPGFQPLRSSKQGFLKQSPDYTKERAYDYESSSAFDLDKRISPESDLNKPFENQNVSKIDNSFESEKSEQDIPFISEQKFKKTPGNIPTGFENLDLSDIEQVDYLIDLAHKKIDKGDFGSINELYNEIYHRFFEIVNLSPNEEELLKNRILKLFDKIKHHYLKKLS